jgi:hypothetical protein
MRILAGLVILLGTLSYHPPAIAQVDAKTAFTLPEKQVEAQLPKSHPSAYYSYATRLFQAGKKKKPFNGSTSVNCVIATTCGPTQTFPQMATPPSWHL